MPIPKNLPAHAKVIFEKVIESLKGKENPRTGRLYTDEAGARIAWSAVKRKFKKIGNRWVRR